MSRQLKFRAWDKESQKIYYVVTLDTESVYGKCEVPIIRVKTGKMLDEYQPEYKTVYDYTLMQYTGLKDKNGVEIYEGDIVLCEIYSKEYVGLVEYTNTYGFYYLSGMGRSDTELWGCNEKKVLGNIYENPELMV